MSEFERDDEEIIRYYRKIRLGDNYGVWGTELMLRLPLKKAQLFMKPDHGWTEETWERSRLKKSSASVLIEMEDYFQFATEQVVLHRGNAARRSIDHYRAWTWLINDMELFGFFIDERNYTNYGCPMLLGYAQKYDQLDLLPPVAADYTAFMNMAQGRKCSDLCVGGCGQGSPKLLRPLDILLPPNGKLIAPL